MKRVLLITGGHDFDRDAFFAMWKACDDIAFQNVEYPHAETFFTPEKSAAFDAFVFYDFGRTMSAAAKTDFLRLLKQGKGLVFLHHALLGHEDWPEYPRITGGAWIDRERTIDGRLYAPSQYAPNQTIDVHIADVAHPITAGLQNFTLIDETYSGLYINPAVKPLLTTAHPKSERLLGWTQSYDQSRVVYLQPGHGASAFDNPNYRTLLRQAIHWVSARA